MKKKLTKMMLCEEVKGHEKQKGKSAGITQSPSNRQCTNSHEKKLGEEIHDYIWSCFDEIIVNKKSTGTQEDNSTSESEKEMESNLSQEESENNAISRNFSRQTSGRSSGRRKALINSEVAKYMAEPL